MLQPRQPAAATLRRGRGRSVVFPSAISVNTALCLRLCQDLRDHRHALPGLVRLLPLAAAEIQGGGQLALGLGVLLVDQLVVVHVADACPDQDAKQGQLQQAGTGGTATQERVLVLVPSATVGASTARSFRLGQAFFLRSTFAAH